MSTGPFVAALLCILALSELQCTAGHVNVPPDPLAFCHWNALLNDAIECPLKDLYASSTPLVISWCQPISNNILFKLLKSALWMLSFVVHKSGWEV